LLLYSSHLPLGVPNGLVIQLYATNSFLAQSTSNQVATPPGGAACPGPRPPVVRAPWSTSDAAPSPIKTPRWEKPKYLINFLETHRDPLPSSTRDREGTEALPGTLPGRGITTGGLLHRHACLWCDEWVVYLGLWVHSSS
jgi:hypothetical protein